MAPIIACACRQGNACPRPACRKQEAVSRYHPSLVCSGMPSVPCRRQGGRNSVAWAQDALRDSPQDAMNAKDAASPAKPGRPMLAMTVEEAAGVLRASPKTVMEAIRRRELSARKLGRSWRISPKALEDWLCRPEPLSPEEAGRQRALEEFRTGWHDLNAFLGRHEIPAGVFCFALEADDGSYCPVMPNGERWPLAHGRTGAPSRPRGKDEGPGSSRSPARRGGKPKRKTPGTPAGRTALRLKSSPFRQARSAPSSGRPGRLRLRTWIRSVPGPLRWTSSAAMRKAPARTGDSSSCCRNAPEGQGGGFLGAPGDPRTWTCLRTAPSLHVRFCLPARRFCLRRILEWRYGDCGASSRDAQRPRPLGECVPCTTRGYFPRSLVAPAWTLMPAPGLRQGKGKGASGSGRWTIACRAPGAGPEVV